MDRRNFLINTGITAAAGAISGAGFVAGQSLPPPPPASAQVKRFAADPPAWGAVRGQFDRLAPDYIHLSSFFLVSHPRPVREAIEKYRLAIDENPFVFVEHNIETMTARVQAAAAEYLGGKSEEVALTNSTTMGLALVYQGLTLRPGQEILTTAHDHFVHHEAIRLAAERSGAGVKKIALFDDYAAISEEGIVERIKRAVTPQTRAVGVTWVHSGSGLKLPLRAIAAAVAEANRGRDEAGRILLVVDGVHGFGVEDETIAETGADFFISGTHKWIFGPRGTGIVWARSENWKALRMVFPAFARETVFAWLTDSELSAPMRAAWLGQGGFHAFEHEWALPAAFDFHRVIGRRRIAERIHALNNQLKEGLAKIPRVKLYTPRGDKLSAGLVCFDVDGMTSEEVVRRLLKTRVVASTTPYKNPFARLAPSLLNTPEEIESALREIRALV